MPADTDWGHQVDSLMNGRGCGGLSATSTATAAERVAVRDLTVKDEPGRIVSVGQFRWTNVTYGATSLTKRRPLWSTVTERSDTSTPSGRLNAELHATGNSSAAVMGNDYAGAGATIGPAMVSDFIGALHAAESDCDAR